MIALSTPISMCDRRTGITTICAFMDDPFLAMRHCVLLIARNDQSVDYIKNIELHNSYISLHDFLDNTLGGFRWRLGHVSVHKNSELVDSYGAYFIRGFELYSYDKPYLNFLCQFHSYLNTYETLMLLREGLDIRYTKFFDAMLEHFHERTVSANGAYALC